MVSSTGRCWVVSLILGVFLGSSLRCLAQEAGSRQLIQTETELGGWAATAQPMPFWLRANQYGIVPDATPAVTLRLGIRKDYQTPDTLTKRSHRFGWSFGLNPLVNAGRRTQVLLPEAYVAIKFGAIELSVGRRRQLTGLGDSTLSSGFMIGSGNALPIPKLQLATRGYVPIGFLKKWVAINAGYAHGWFNVPYIQGSYLHQKYLYWRFGKPSSTVKVHVGINHQAQWGGRADYLLADPNIAVNGKLPASLKYYPYVVFAINPGEWANDDYTSFDGAYRIGNHVGSIDGAIEIQNSSGNWLLYHQHVYEDVSGLLFINAPDGLTGLRWKRNEPLSTGIQHVVVEYLGTLNQSGSTFDLTSAYQGNDNYFNHGQYREGWSYLGRSIGTPFIAPGNELKTSATGGEFFPNNRVQAWYVGATGNWRNRLTWTTRLAYSRNHGTYANPYPSPVGQFSGLLAAQLPLPVWSGTRLNVSLAIDQGDLLPSTIGSYVSLVKRW